MSAPSLTDAFCHTFDLTKRLDHKSIRGTLIPYSITPLPSNRHEDDPDGTLSRASALQGFTRYSCRDSRDIPARRPSTASWSRASCLPHSTAPLALSPMMSSGSYMGSGHCYGDTANESPPWSRFRSHYTPERPALRVGWRSFRMPSLNYACYQWHPSMAMPRASSTSMPCPSTRSEAVGPKRWITRKPIVQAKRARRSRHREVQPSTYRRRGRDGQRPRWQQPGEARILKSSLVAFLGGTHEARRSRAVRAPELWVCKYRGMEADPPEPFFPANKIDTRKLFSTLPRKPQTHHTNSSDSVRIVHTPYWSWKVSTSLNIPHPSRIRVL